MELVQWQVEQENKAPGQWGRCDWAHSALQSDGQADLQCQGEDSESIHRWGMYLLGLRPIANKTTYIMIYELRKTNENYFLDYFCCFCAIKTF